MRSEKPTTGRKGVVNIMGHAAGHLAERLETFLLHDGLLGLPQVIIGLLQVLVELRLVDGHGHVRAQAADKIAFGPAETVHFAPHEYHQSKHFVLDNQGYANRRI